MENEKTENDNKIKCSKCGSSFGYLRIKDKTWVCRSCGHEEVREEK